MTSYQHCSAINRKMSPVAVWVFTICSTYFYFVTQTHSLTQQFHYDRCKTTSSMEVTLIPSHTHTHTHILTQTKTTTMPHSSDTGNVWQTLHDWSSGKSSTSEFHVSLLQWEYKYCKSSSVELSTGVKNLPALNNTHTHTHTPGILFDTSTFNSFLNPTFPPNPPPPPQLSFFPYHQGSESDSASNEVSAFVQLPDTVVFDALAVLDGEGQRVLLTGASTDEESATEVAREQQPLLCFSSGNVTKIPAGERGRAQQ